jgi:hypothetical protein
LAAFAGEADAVGLEGGVAFAAAVDFLACFFVGDADATGVGLGVGSAARTRGIVAKAAKARRVVSVRIMPVLGIYLTFGKTIGGVSETVELDRVSNASPYLIS